MKFGPIEKKDKQGRLIVLRSPEVTDAERMLKYLKIVASETLYLLQEPEEVTMTLEQEEEFLKKKIETERELLLLAEIDGKHIGNASLMSCGPFKRYTHRCHLAVALLKEYWSAGIGEIMLETIFSIAKQVGYEQVELEVVTDNLRALALYKKLGFVQYGTLPNNMKYKDGSYADTYWMMKKL